MGIRIASVVFPGEAVLIVLVVVVASDVAFPSPKTKDPSPEKGTGVAILQVLLCCRVYAESSW